VAKGKNNAINSAGTATITVSIAVKELVLNLNHAFGLGAH
jgi:hypothetical protein